MRKSRTCALVTSCAVVGVLVLGGTSIAWAFPAPRPGAPTHRQSPGQRCGHTFDRQCRTITGTVSGIGTGRFTITEPDGTSLVIDTTAATVYSESGTTTAPTGVAVGDRVDVIGVDDTRKAPFTTAGSTATTTPVAARVEIVLARVQGTVSAVSASSFDLTGFDGIVQVVDTTSSTIYTEAGTTVSGVGVGEAVTAYGTADATDPTQLDVVSVSIASSPTGQPPVVAAAWHIFTGTVTALGTGGFTITGLDGTTQAIDTTAATMYSELGTTTAPTGVAVGDRVDVIPVVDDWNAWITATTAATTTTPVAARVEIVLARVQGTVSAVSASSFDLTGFDGIVQVVDTDVVHHLHGGRNDRQWRGRR